MTGCHFKSQPDFGCELATSLARVVKSHADKAGMKRDKKRQAKTFLQEELK